MRPRLTRVIDGVELPDVDVWTIDATHSALSFRIRHLGFSYVRGSFGAFGGYIDVKEDPRKSSVFVEIDVTSIDTKVKKRDEHLQSKDFFTAEQHPRARFTSREVEYAGGAKALVKGDFEINGVSKPVTLEAEILGATHDQKMRSRVAFEATTSIDRRDYDIVWNKPLETGALFVDHRVEIQIEIQAVANRELAQEPHYAIPLAEPGRELTLVGVDTEG